MNEELRDEILRRLMDSKLDDLAIELIDAACEGAEAFERTLMELGARPRPKPPEAADPGKTTEPPGAYLKKLSLAGFRGVGPKLEVNFRPGPGLTLIVGRNGSGKSSLAEGLETLLTGDSGRWAGRKSRLWRQGWRNLHRADGGTRLGAELVVEGAGALDVMRKWSEDEELDGGEIRVNGPSGQTSLAALGWDAALTSFRPFLSYPELGALVDQPSKAFDKLWSLLGLEELVDARSLLGERRKFLDREAKTSRDERKALIAALSEVEGPRARACREALEAKQPDLAGLAELVAGDVQNPTEDEARVRALARLAVPTLDTLGTAIRELRSAVAAKRAQVDANAELHDRLAEVLSRALEVLEAAPEACPVCERPMGQTELDRARARLSESREAAARLREANAAIRAALEDACAPLRPLLELGLVAGTLDLGASGAAFARAAQAYAREPKAVDEWPAHIEGAGLEMVAAAEPARDAAREKLRGVDEAFRPLQRRLAAWLEQALRVEESTPLRKPLKGAEDWLRQVEADLRDARFTPIADQVQEIWSSLGNASHVSLDGVALAGSGTKRRVDLDVKVDGHGGPAEAVMSQGELNALSLSLFLPRMMLPESPFRFLVVDDPVQAMDPIKVDGLARVLADVGKRRQVLVFTHDERLLEAVRRLRIEATVLEVSRRAESVVEVIERGGPVAAHLKDARALLGQPARELNQEIKRRLVPGFCRAALEAACVEITRRRRLGAGAHHEEVEELIASAHGLMALLSLAFFDSADRGGEVYRRANQWGQWAGDALRACKEGAHGKWEGDLGTLVSDTARLADKLAGLS